MASEFKTTRRVEFSETDMAGIVHFSNYFKYMESTEHAFVRSLGLSVAPQNTTPPIGWPRVSVSCDYKQPLKYEDEVETHLKVESLTEKAITYLFTIRKNGEKAVCAIGRMTVVCVTFREGRMQATFIPREYADKIEVATDY
jgi:YbgC/YbaW family acyl-CoA thioester hydrolase